MFFKFGTKNALFDFFGLQFWETICICEINTLKFVKKFRAKQKKLIWEQKWFIYSSIFRLKWKNNYCHIWNQHSTFVTMHKINACKTNFFQNWDQECLICAFLGCNFERLSAYGTSALLDLSKCKALGENKNP